MGRLPKKPVEAKEPTRTSQRLRQISSGIPSPLPEKKVAEKKAQNQKVKTIKSQKLVASQEKKVEEKVTKKKGTSKEAQKAQGKMDVEESGKPASNKIEESKGDEPRGKEKKEAMIDNELQEEDDLEGMMKSREPLKPAEAVSTEPAKAMEIEPMTPLENKHFSFAPNENEDDDEFEMMMKKKSAAKKEESVQKGRIDFKPEDFVQEVKEKVEDRYYFMKPPLGSGLFGTVYKAKNKKTGVIRAIKRIKKDLKIAKTYEDLLKDVDILKTLDHPNIIKVFEFYQDDAAYYIVTDFCSGGELFENILKEKNFTERKAAELMRQILSAVAYCHERHLVHCDLKPENIMFESQDGNNLIKLIDFGNSSFVQKDERLTNRFGSVYYVAPEVLMSSYNEKCDIWSVGVILFLVLSGKPPFNGASDQIILKKVYEGKYKMDGEEWNEISEEAKDLVKRMLTFDPDQRISAKECLNHRWIKETGKIEDHRLKLAIGKRTMRNLKTFRGESRIQEAILYYIVGQLASKEEREDMMNTFMNLDKDNDGKLTRSDLISVYVNQGEDLKTVEATVDEILKNIDKSDKGYIDYSEYLTASLSKRRMFSEDRLTAAFNLFDTEERGYITIDDIKSILNKGAFSQVDESLWSALIGDVASENDGKIDFETFKGMMTLFINNEQVTQSLAL